jgi:transcription elongation factor Elf1
MALAARRLTEYVDCASCPECERVLVLHQLPPESKRPFVQGHSQGFVLVCRACGCEFPVRTSELMHLPVEISPVH